MLNKFWKLLVHKKRAIRFGIPFLRMSSFTLPKSLMILGKRQTLDLPTNDNGLFHIVKEIILEDCYGLESLAQELPSNIKILDIGANVGIFAMVARSFFPSSVIHSYEPNSKLEKYIKHQATNADFQYFVEAVGSQKGKVRLEIDQKTAVLTRSFIDEKGDFPMISLSEAIKRIGGKVDLIKIDCEGAEWMLFEDKEAWLLIENITMEYHLKRAKKTVDELKKIIEGFGFKITYLQTNKDFSGLLRASR